MQAVTGAMGSLIPKLWDLLKGEYKLQKGVKEQITSLAKDLESAYAALRKVSNVPPEQLDEQVKLWASEIREASYDMEDILDDFLVSGIEGAHDPTDGKMKLFLEKMRNNLSLSKSKKRHKIAVAIQDIKKHIQEVSERRGSYTVDSIDVAMPAASGVDPRLDAMYKQVEELIGIDKARGELMSMLTSTEQEDKKIKRVSVVGVGGLGKTTLAKAVYDKLKSDYDCGAFVPVGRNPDVRKVLKDVLVDLDMQRYTSINMTVLDERQLINELREFLMLKRYLIVIDDIWDIVSWETIKLALIENKCGSAIVTTTRNFEVARESGEVYMHQPLSNENSQKLFYTRIYGDEGKCLTNQLDPDMISARILKKCGGIPLAIITMASLLVGKPREQWSEVYSSIGFGSKENRHVENTMRILSFSYYDLPPHLRTPLLYLSTFPEDFLIDKSTLIWKWIAEGFVVSDKQGSISLFEVGEGYFNDLINRSLIQAVYERGGIIDGCRVHDMVLDLLHSIACEENFVSVFSSNDENKISRDNVRRLVHQNITVSQTNQRYMPQVRSFVAYWCNYDDLFPLSRFKYLRVLAIEHCPHKKEGYRLEHVGNLLHLRYLGLIGTSICELPEEIGALKFLQTLDLRGADIRELPSSVGLLTQLSCLRGDSWCTSLPDGIISKLTLLEELEIFAGDNAESKRRFLKELGGLKKLRLLNAELRIMEDNMQKDLVESLSSLNKIQDFSLQCDTAAADMAAWESAGFVVLHCLRRLILADIFFSRLPSCINPTNLPNLFELSLYIRAMDEHDLKILGGLPELRCLYLTVESTITVRSIATDNNVGCFQKLKLCSMGFSMLQFMRNEDSTLSLHLWNGKDAIPFGSENKDIEKARAGATAVMPSVEVLVFAVHVRPLYDAGGSCDINLGLECLPSLKDCMVYVNSWGASITEVEEVKAALRHAMAVHPNRPILKIRRCSVPSSTMIQIT